MCMLSKPTQQHLMREMAFLSLQRLSGVDSWSLSFFLAPIPSGRSKIKVGRRLCGVGSICAPRSKREGEEEDVWKLYSMNGMGEDPVSLVHGYDISNGPNKRTCGISPVLFLYNDPWLYVPEAYASSVLDP